MGLLDRAVDRLKAEEAQTKSERAPSRPAAKPKRTESRERRSAEVPEQSAAGAPASAAGSRPEYTPEYAPEYAPGYVPDDAPEQESEYESEYEPEPSSLADPGSQNFHDWPVADDGRSALFSAGRAAIDLAGLAKLGFVVPGFPPNSWLLDEQRRIKRALLFNAAVDQLDDSPILFSNLVLISSAVAGEGKTFVSINLALVLSLEVDRQTLLIDADVIRRGASQLLGLEERPGLIDYLAGDFDDLDDLLLRPEGIDNLQILPAGRPHANVNELLASERMKDLVEELALADRNRLVVIDSPPILMTSETGLLTRYAGQIALVVRADSTPRHSVDLALASIPPERFAGLILNDAARIRSVDGYSEYYEE